MTAIGTHVPRQERPRIAPRAPRAIGSVGPRIDVDTAMAKIRALQIRLRAAAARMDIAEQAEASEQRRLARRAAAAYRRIQQRRVRIALGTDRATIRAAAAPTPTRTPTRTPGRIRALDRSFARA